MEEKCKQTRRHKCMYTISICPSQCNYSKKRQQFHRLVCFAQNTHVHTSGKNVKLHDWPRMGRQLDVKWIILFFSLYQEYLHLPAAARLLQRTSQNISVSPKHHQSQRRLEVPSMHAGNRCTQTLTSKPREALVQHTQKTRRTRKIQRKAFLFWLQLLTANLEDLETHVPAHFSEWEISDSEGEAFKVEKKNEAQCFVLSSAKTKKGFILRTEKYGDFTTAEQKVLNEGRESRNNHRYFVVLPVLATQWNPRKTNTTGYGQEFTKVSCSCRRSQKLVIRTTCEELANLLKNYHGFIERQHFIAQKQTELQNDPYDG